MKVVHFIGIGGYSMSGLALLLHGQGYRVTGSDMKRSSRTERLERAGIPVYYEHRTEWIHGQDVVVYNTDVGDDNPERQEAERQGILLVHRSEVLADALLPYEAITVSGTHGKTTTTTMIGTILQHQGLSPTVLVGGEVPQFNGNLLVGQGPYAVAEADESDGTFLRYNPIVAVATNVEAEHLDHFGGRFELLVAAFEAYLTKVPSHGLAVVGVDNAILREMSTRLTVSVMGYGLTADAMVRATNIHPAPGGTGFTLEVQGRSIGAAELTVPGIHNVVNALGALTAAQHVGVSWTDGMESLRQFKNAARRFQILLDGPTRVVDDYAHHPTEIQSTLAAARQVTPGRVIALFQPQRYVRTKNLWDQFVESFADADRLYLTDIYSPPGEPSIPGVSGALLAEAVAKHQGRDVAFYPDMMGAIEPILSDLRPGDTFITMGAGNVFQVAEIVADQLRSS